MALNDICMQVDGKKNLQEIKSLEKKNPSDKTQEKETPRTCPRKTIPDHGKKFPRT